MQKPYGNCTGTKTQFKCDCNHDYSHPVDSDLLEPIEAKCRVSCDHKQCGFTQGNLHGQCKGSNISFICECHRGFDHPRDIAGNPILSQCQDVNECKISDNLCDKNADCINIPGGFKCKCHENFVGEGFKEKGCYPNGGWDVWQHHDCSVSCGGGFMKKSRDCLVPLQYRTKDICDGEEVEDNIPCNNFPCQGLCLRRKCNCKQAIPYINKYLPKEKRRSYESYAKHENHDHASYSDYKRDLENFNSNDDDADIFEDVKQFKFEDASLLLAKFVQLTSKNLCIENEFGTLDGIMNDVNKDMQMVRDSIEEFRKKKYEIQIVISCNENPYIVDELFRSYRSLTEHMFLTKLMMEDLMNQKKKIMAEISKCKREQSFDLGDMMGMIG